MPRPSNAGIAAAGRAVLAWRGTEKQEEAARRAGISPDTLGDLELGNRWPRNMNRRAIEDAFGKTRGTLDEIAAEADAAREPRRLRPETMEKIRADLGDELGAQAIALLRDVASGELPGRPAPRAAGSPRESAGSRRRESG